jgi:hypothetical protein
MRLGLRGVGYGNGVGFVFVTERSILYGENWSPQEEVDASPVPVSEIDGTRPASN